MFVRNLKHKNGKIYIQVVGKSSGAYKVLKSFGTSDTPDGLEALVVMANQWIKEKNGLIEFDFDN
ncbi:MAG TPA: hypothetical protein VGA80_03140 [Flavobacteriaceae bacterium]|jgi:hypothetical protein